VDAHRVEVLHVADGDAVVARVAHDLVLDLLPAREVLLHEDLRVYSEGFSERFVELGSGVARCR
jgi:hypothetical protein